MTKGNKRKPDLRKIRTTKVYQVQDIADVLGRDARTVRKWIDAGLPTLSGQGTALVDGAALRNWLKARSMSLKRKCLPNQFYCFKCRRPRNARSGSILFEARNAKTIRIKALCGLCGTRMNKTAASAELAKVQANFLPSKPQIQHLVGCDDPSVNKQFSVPSQTGSEIGIGEGQKLAEINALSKDKIH